MRGFMVLCLAAIATAVPQGYNYQAPAGGSYGGGGSYQGASSIASPTYAHHAAGGALGGIGGGAFGGLGGAGGSLGGAGSSLGGAGGSLGGAGGSLGGASGALGGSYGGSYGGGAAGGSITKNFFIHSAPEDSDDDILRDSQSAGPTNKKYNVVFVKAPAQSAKAAALALRKAQSEEKTLIYVLTKNIDASDLQAALAGAPTEPTKPEVVFIKYKTPEEAAHAQHQIQEQYEALGGGPSHVSDEGIAPVSSVIGSLGHTGGAGGGHFGAASGQHVSSNYLPPSH